MHLDEVARQRANKFQPRRTVQPSDTRSLYTRSRIDLQSVRKEKAARRAEQEARVARVDPIFNMTLEDFPTDFGTFFKRKIRTPPNCIVICIWSKSCSYSLRHAHREPAKVRTPTCGRNKRTIRKHVHDRYAY